MHDELEAQPEGKRQKNAYKKVIAAYYDVYRLDPAYGKSPAALTTLAELYREHGS